MAIERIHPRKRLLASVARERTDVEMQILVPLAIVLARKALVASWPFALERSFFVM